MDQTAADTAEGHQAHVSAGNLQAVPESPAPNLWTCDVHTNDSLPAAHLKG